MPWIVITGSLVDTTEGGGFEFFGPFASEEDAMDYRRKARAAAAAADVSDQLVLAVELLKPSA